jgi:hypothetical protein
MINRSMTAPAVAIDGSFYTVRRLPFADPYGIEVELDHVPLGRQPRRSPRRIALPVLEALIATGDAVLVVGVPLDDTTRRPTRRQAEAEAVERPMTPAERGADGWMLHGMVSGRLRSAAAPIDDDARLEPA